MKKILILLSILFGSTLIFATSIDENTAKVAGKNFLLSKNFSEYEANNLNLLYKCQSNSTLNTSKDPLVYYYIFSIEKNGFIIVSATDDVKAILAYSFESVFDVENITPNVKKWLEGYKSQIRYVIEMGLQATDEIKSEWAALKSGHSINISKSTTAVSPLVQTKWDQAPYYNDLCPYDNTYHKKTVTGCVATAMAQIMKFWNYPQNGEGFHSYNHGTYGTLSANFGSTAYQWSSMPNQIYSANNAIATLMYHVGVSVNMDYGVAETGGSGAYVISSASPVENCSEFALKNYFGYKTSLSGKRRVNYTDSQWISMIKADLDAARPVLYAGFGDGGGHCFVCDGYDNGNYFHFNWGWGGSYDGYFEISALNPGGVGIGGGSGGFNSGQQAIFGIEPSSGGGGSQTFSLNLNNYVTPSYGTINYGSPFSVTTDIVNNGNSSFNGDFCAAVFDAEGICIDIIDILTNYSLPAGHHYTNGITFQTGGLFSMLPATYQIGIFYRPSGGNWIIVSNSGNYINGTQISVVWSNDIEIYSDIIVTPSPIINGNSVAVNLDILNDGNSSFVGYYGVGLFNLEGYLEQTIEVLHESDGLPPNYHYSAPYITFENSVVDVAPGTYLLACQHKRETGNWQLTGSSYRQNPIKVIVQEEALEPDIYEINNTVSQAYSIPISFTSNTTIKKDTPGANLHVGDDEDYYKIFLPSGYSYSVNARLHDSYNSGNGKSYTVDALFTYSLNGTTWSDVYDDIMSSSFSVQDGGTVYFHIAPYYTGSVGTYLFEINVSRYNTGIEDNEKDFVRVFPNPASDFIMVSISNSDEIINTIEIINEKGQCVNTVSINNNNANISLNNLSSGVYILNISTTNRIINRKFVKNE